VLSIPSTKVLKFSDGLWKFSQHEILAKVFLRPAADFLAILYLEHGVRVSVTVTDVCSIKGCGCGLKSPTGLNIGFYAFTTLSEGRHTELHSHSPDSVRTRDKEVYSVTHLCISSLPGISEKKEGLMNGRPGICAKLHEEGRGVGGDSDAEVLEFTASDQQHSATRPKAGDASVPPNTSAQRLACLCRSPVCTKIMSVPRFSHWQRQRRCSRCTLQVNRVQSLETPFWGNSYHLLQEMSAAATASYRLNACAVPYLQEVLS